MRSVKSGLASMGLAAFVGIATVVGCAASGADVEGVTTEKAPTEGTQLEESNPPADEDGEQGNGGGGTDAGRTKSDGGTTPRDAGAPAPNTGDACQKVDVEFTKSCGRCGSQKALCESSGDAGALTVGTYGACGGEKPESATNCMPGSTEVCGNCGTRTCSNSCTWGSCTGQPTGACAPGTVGYTSASCPANEYQQRTCGQNCLWGPYSGSANCAAPNNPQKLNISGTAGGTVSGNYTLAANRTGRRSPGFCPATSAATVSFATEVIEIRNTTAKTAKVSVALSGSPSIDTVLAVYPSTLPPTTDAELKACTIGNDECGDNFGVNWSCTGAGAVTLAPGAANLVRVSGWDATSVGNFTLTVKTDSIQ